ncbi:hypothetical protein Cenrod_0367 [Candidatus Symbiobacter mobilis CR]|uniref:Uncharacterized protein n=1 Tax=Candidatus Symbiobacter mobilis CR TaxID=946483 RepID=U5N5F5_9BURK|nr:hypothetical protein Cenrod_0367 [Candidatus Symbiobacter mobilis CR]
MTSPSSAVRGELREAASRLAQERYRPTPSDGFLFHEQSAALRTYSSRGCAIALHAAAARLPTAIGSHSVMGGGRSSAGASEGM